MPFYPKVFELEISSSSLPFRLSLVDIDALKPHEEIVESIVRSLANDILTQGEVRDPLMVDRDDYVILDGMHRYNSLKTLRCRFAPCCLLDYDNPKIKVGSWFRLFVVNEADSTAETLLGQENLDYSKLRIKLDDASHSRQVIIMTADGTVFSLSGKVDTVKRARTAVLLEKEMLKKGYAVEYLSETVALERLKSKDVTFVISLPIFTKQQIRECGLRGDLLPHKVTRHVIPSRPLRIDVPLPMLRDATVSLTEADHQLHELLARKHMEIRPPGSIMEGRRYDEELLVFS